MKTLISLMLFLCAGAAAQSQSKSTYTERYRPRFHFSPAANWMNDPNGLVYFRGEYHLFYQHNPFGNRWGHMSWGHAVSPDLIHWKHLPLAIPETSQVMIFSGSAVADNNNSSGLAGRPGQIPLVAIYTGLFTPDRQLPDNTIQYQAAAYSLDAGRTWTQYAHNPILDLHRKDFRDPFVFWYGPQKKWVMLLVFPQEHIVQFYDSKNLLQWNHISDFGPAGDTSAIWECPSLTEVPVAGEAGRKKWVLQNSQQTTMQYFVGDFDGTRFVNENPAGIILRPDYGSDFYAGVTYNQLPKNQPPVMIGWANNWSYANDIPTDPWKSAMGIPRNLSLKKSGDRWLLLQAPQPALTALREKHRTAQNLRVEKTKALDMHGLQGEIILEWTPAEHTRSGLVLAMGEGQALEVGYDATKNILYFDRQFAGESGFNAEFARLTRYEAALNSTGKKLKLHLFIDHSLVEIFANDGELVMTTQIFPDPAHDGIALFSEGGTNNFSQMDFWQIKPAW